MAFPIDNIYIHEGRKARDAAQSIVEHSLNASRSGYGLSRMRDVECLVQTWLSRKSAPTGSPLQEHDVGVGRGEPSGVARIPAPAGKVRKSDIFGNL